MASIAGARDTASLSAGKRAPNARRADRAPSFQRTIANNLAQDYESLTRRATIAAQQGLDSPRIGWRAAMALTGPALIASVAYIDPGNLAANTEAGAHYGYALVWVIVVANLLAMFIQALAAKLGIVTGYNLAELSRAYFPRPAVYAMWICSELMAMATDLAEFLGATLGFALLLGVPTLVGMAITGITTYLVLDLEHRGFRPLELVIATLIAVVGISYVAELVIAVPAWRATAYHMLVPELPDHGAVLLAIAIVGATVMPHAIYLHSGLTQNRVVPRSDEQRRILVRFSNREVLFALGVAGLINIAMLAMAAATFHDGTHNGIVGIAQAYRTLTPLLGGGAAVIFIFALIGSGLSSSVVGTMAGQMVMQGFVGFRIPLWLRRSLTMLPALLIIAAGINPTRALIMSQVILSLGLPIPIISLLMLTSNKRLMGPFANNRLTQAVVIGAVVLILALNTTLLLQTAGLRIR